MKYLVKQKTYTRPGRWEWETINEFDDPAAADEWLSAWIRIKKYIVSDFMIVVK